MATKVFKPEFTNINEQIVHKRTFYALKENWHHIFPSKPELSHPQFGLFYIMRRSESDVGGQPIINESMNQRNQKTHHIYPIRVIKKPRLLRFAEGDSWQAD